MRVKLRLWSLLGAVLTVIASLLFVPPISAAAAQAFWDDETMTFMVKVFLLGVVTNILSLVLYRLACNRYGVTPLPW